MVLINQPYPLYSLGGYVLTLASIFFTEKIQQGLPAKLQMMTFWLKAGWQGREDSRTSQLEIVKQRQDSLEVAKNIHSSPKMVSAQFCCTDK